MGRDRARAAGSAALAPLAVAVLAATAGCRAPSHTRLTMAVSRGDVELVRELVGPHEVDPDQRTRDGWTPLAIAAQHGHTAIARILIDAGAAVDRRRNSWITNFDGTPPLTIAVGMGHAEIVEMLLASGASVDAGDYQVRARPLMWAASGGDAGIVQRLLDAGADVEARDRGGSRALHYAASRHGRAERSTAAAARLLIERGADVDATTDTGATPLHDAASQGNVEVTRLLLDAGAQVKLRTRSGETALSAAAAAGHLEVVRELLPFFLDDSAALDDALARARRENHVEVVGLLAARALARTPSR